VSEILFGYTTLISIINPLGLAFVFLNKTATLTPEERARLLADPSLLPSAVEEILRFRSPNQLGNRETTAEIELDGRRLPRGTNLHLCIGAANRDPAVFDDPTRFDIARKPNRHLAFAGGPHVCVGLTLARLEGRIALGRLLRGRSDLQGVDLWRQVDQAGPLSVPIVSLTCFLVGLMLAYMGGAQLHRIGAPSFIPDVVTVGMVRELAGLMTGVILAGRLGAAFAAQIGSMQATRCAPWASTRSATWCCRACWRCCWWRRCWWPSACWWACWPVCPRRWRPMACRRPSTCTRAPPR